jgi:YegS/Rv2252/BmrU family lipid kinase
MSSCTIAASSTCAVVINPKGGAGRAARWIALIRKWLHEHAPDVTLCVSGEIDEAHRAISRLPAASRVVIVGGDGTLFHCLPALLDRGHSLGVVALGSGNDLARSLGVYGLAWDMALLQAIRGASSAIDVGLCTTAQGQWPFVSSLAGGFDAAVGHRAQAVPSWLRGMPRYLWATFEQLIHLRTYPVTATLDGQAWHTGPSLFVSVLNTPTYGAGMPAVPHATPGDGLLNVVVAGELNRLSTIALLPRLLAGQHLTHPQVQTRQMRHLEVHSAEPLTLAADGEPLPSCTQWSVKVMASALQVVSMPPNAATIMPT